MVDEAREDWPINRLAVCGIICGNVHLCIAVLAHLSVGRRICCFTGVIVWYHWALSGLSIVEDVGKFSAFIATFVLYNLQVAEFIGDSVRTCAITAAQEASVRIIMVDVFKAILDLALINIPTNSCNFVVFIKVGIQKEVLSEKKQKS